MGRGFIAAPLLGTLIFLISVLLIINLSRSESAAVAETVSDAYHNRLVSLVEIYRSDLGSLFNIGLQRSIEYGLTSQCWANFLPIHTEAPAAPQPDVNYHGYNVKNDPNSDGIVEEKEERMYYCARSSEIIQSVICSKKTDYLYGLPSWARILADPTSFEGVSLKVANADAFISLIGFEDSGSGADLCRSLVSGVELDCKDFADHGSEAGYRFKCCSAFDSSGNCASEVPGCADGNQFFVRINVQAPEVYKNFPRVLAEDSAGNKIRAGAITDRDYDAVVSYPFYRYLNTAFKFNRILAFGPNSARDTTEKGAARGVVEGSCLGAVSGTAGCDKTTPVGFHPGVDYVISPKSSGEDMRKEYSTAFMGSVASSACALASTTNLETQFNIKSEVSTWTSCENTKASATAPEVLNTFNVYDPECGALAGSPVKCGEIRALQPLEIRFVDNDNTVQVDPSRKNEFCWSSNIEYLPA